jgi:cytochrome bd-type quinol oxidase subunit 2
MRGGRVMENQDEQAKLRMKRAAVAFSLLTLVVTVIWFIACEGEYVSIFLIPILQWIYVIPVILWAAITRRNEVAIVFAIGAALVLLLGGAGCFAFLGTAGGIGG